MCADHFWSNIVKISQQKQKLLQKWKWYSFFGSKDSDGFITVWLCSRPYATYFTYFIVSCLTLLLKLNCHTSGYKGKISFKKSTIIQIADNSFPECIHSSTLWCWFMRYSTYSTIQIEKENFLTSNFTYGFWSYYWWPMIALDRINKKLSWCWQTRATRLHVSQGQQT